MSNKVKKIKQNIDLRKKAMNRSFIGSFFVTAAKVSGKTADDAYAKFNEWSTKELKDFTYQSLFKTIVNEFKPNEELLYNTLPNVVIANHPKLEPVVTLFLPNTAEGDILLPVDEIGAGVVSVFNANGKASSQVELEQLFPTVEEWENA